MFVEITAIMTLQQLYNPRIRCTTFMYKRIVYATPTRSAIAEHTLAR